MDQSERGYTAAKDGWEDMMLKKHSMILGITTVSAALFLVVIPSQDSFAIGVPPLSPKPRMPIGPPGKYKPNNAWMKKGPAAEDHKGLDTTHGSAHFHLPHSKKCKDIYGNLVLCQTFPP
jgi:hypothetical protein